MTQSLPPTTALVTRQPNPVASATTAPKPPAQRWPRIWGPRFWKLAGFGAALFLYRLWVIHHSGMSLFFDEAQYWDWSRHLDWGYYSKPPLIAGLIWLSTALFGSGVLGVKALTIALYPITALCLVGFARSLWPTSSGVRTGLVAAAVFMTLPMTGILGLAASTDAPLLLCWTLAAWALWRAQVTNRLPYWAGFGAALGLGIMAKYTMAAFLVSAVWAVFAIPGPKRGVLRAGPWLALLVAAVVVAPNVIWNAQHGYPTLHHTVDITTDSARGGGLFKALQFTLGQLAMLGPLTVVAGVWLWRQQQQSRAAQAAQGSGMIGSTTIWRSSIQHALTPEDAAKAGGPGMAKQSAIYLASVSSYRYLWALSLPLQAIAIVQAFRADSHVNWAAPSMVGFTLLIASRLSLPLVSMSTPRPTRWLTGVLLTNLLLTSAVLHLKDVAGDRLPSNLDIMARMRGWQESYAQMLPTLNDPVVRGLPVLTDSRLLITQSAYNLRKLPVQTLIWNPHATAHNHYEMTRSLPNKVGQDVVLITDDAQPQAILSRFAIVKVLQDVHTPIGPDRSIDLHVYFLRGFLGYDERTYQEQSGAGILPRDDVPN